MLMNQCPHLRALLDLDYWEGITEAEREKLRLNIKLNNIDLQISEDVPDTDLRGGSDVPEYLLTD